MDDRGPLLQAERFCLKRGPFSLQDISFTLSEEEVLCFLGKTGAGKTLLLESAAGFCLPDAGHLYFRGVEVSRIPIHRRNIGYLCQDYSLFPNMTVRANIGYGLRMQRRTRADIRSSVEEIAEWFEIGHRLEHYPGTLSGGEQQRVALARALITRPSLLLMDEPFSALDPRTRQKIISRLAAVRQELPFAMICVTHDFQEALEISARIGILAGGKLCGIADRDRLYSSPWPPEAAELLGIEETR